MSTLIVAFPKLEEAKAVRNLLIHRGFDVAVPCTSGAQAINQADTCLLYTSPSPRDRTRSRMPSSA